MLKNNFFVITFLWLVLFLALPVRSQIEPMFESWNNAAYYDTNLQQKGYNSLLGRFEGKIGLRTTDFIFPVHVYGAYYTVFSQNNNYWDNAIYPGLGIRCLPLTGYNAAGWYDEWLRSAKFFVETLSSSYVKNSASAEGLAKTDFRVGMDLWHEWNLDDPDYNVPWGELWTNLSYRDTNFGWEPFQNYIFYFQPKVGWHIAKGLETYLRFDLTNSGKSGASYSYLNVMDYGIGLRIEPWRNITGDNEFIRKFKLFAEVLGVSYLKDKPATANQTVASDVRFGIDFSYGR